MLSGRVAQNAEWLKSCIMHRVFSSYQRFKSHWALVLIVNSDIALLSLERTKIVTDNPSEFLSTWVRKRCTIRHFLSHWHLGAIWPQGACSRQIGQNIAYCPPDLKGRMKARLAQTTTNVGDRDNHLTSQLPHVDAFSQRVRTLVQWLPNCWWKRLPSSDAPDACPDALGLLVLQSSIENIWKNLPD